MWADTKEKELRIEGVDNTNKVIKSLGTSDEKKFLGVFDGPEGGNVKQLEKIKDKVEVFVKRMTNGKLPAYLGWMAYNHKLWAGVRYGIGTMTDDIEVVNCFLDKLDYLMMNVLGVCCKIKVGWRKLHLTFGGIGLFNFVTEQLIERLNLLLQNYGTDSVLSNKMDTSLAYLQLQLGVNCCPFDLVYDEWHYMAPLSWMKMLWRTLQVTGVELHLDYDC